jgi:Stress responsive A/B Barrel Domain
MKYWVTAGMLALIVTFSMLSSAPAQVQQGQLYHVVSLKFKEGAAAGQIKDVEAAFASLKSKVPGIRTLHWGTDVSPEKLSKGFTHCFVLTFDNDKDRDAYLVHPDHKAFGKVLGPVLGDVLVIDFWAK